MRRWKLVVLLGALLFCQSPRLAHAFCGFYVSGADAKLFNNATLVVLMREGTLTVLSMQNSYQGPPAGFAMVVPVPVVLQKENVKTLPKAVFERVDQLTAPRLVEYWEQDPCAERVKALEAPMAGAPRSLSASAGAKGGGLGVTVEAQFTVGEYEIVILSARDSNGLDTWLKLNGYRIPAGAEPVLRPYVESGSKFFVAKVDSSKVRFENGQAMLSPLRFHYDSKDFSLPVRLGLLNSGGTQDLIVHILARGKRYEVANYPNVTIPTNFDVREDARDRFGELYASLFDQTLAKHPRAVVTEYAWDASSCDPCPTPALNPAELSTLGSDVVDARDVVEPAPTSVPPAPGLPPGMSRPGRVPPRRWGGWRGGFVLTRLHVRYGKDALGEDLVFREAPAIAGGREFRTGDQLEHGAMPASQNNFQARYAIRHPWQGPIDCKDPQRGIWGGPPTGGVATTKPATNLAFAPRGKLQLASMVRSDVPELGLKASAPTEKPQTSEPERARGRGCLGCRVGASNEGESLLPAIALLLTLHFRRMARRRRT